MSEAEACFCQAIDLARRHGAKLVELLAVVRLSQFWQQQGKTDDARHKLAEIYGWFTEGSDAKHLHEARAHLEKLA